MTNKKKSKWKVESEKYLETNGKQLSKINEMQQTVLRGKYSPTLRKKKNLKQEI